jgi:hypothetical protein
MHVVADTGGTGWVTPVATLMAVLIGGLVNWIAQAKLASRRASTEAAAIRDQRAADAQLEQERRSHNDAAAARIRSAEERAAARVIQGDLSISASRLKDMTEDQRWMGFYTFALPSWGALQLTIARAEEIDATAWEIVSQSALELFHFEDGLNRAVGPDGPHAGAHVRPMSSPSAQAGIHAMWDSATKAYNALAAVAGTAEVAGRLHATG